ncbi:hypothetical protein GWC95_19310 [Sediminibacterium roseum]|uniref:DUF1735 domain-containing protein n=1 Tax=Sediminibacterium roseum TaxID=1978412 RepID=A0ABW9ZY27_9BACT|nr:hypothetical protein [Sediminibacterium roseum]NCI52082.1 hypothetical protein [Sediminibacterium roseum]
MKSVKYIAAMFIAAVVFSSCEKKDYPAGLSSEEHHYYSVFVPNNNTLVSYTKNQAALVKFPVQFYSTFTRSYDAVAKYVIVPDATANAVLGVDFAVVDKNGTVIAPGSDGAYSIVFPKAVQATDTIYLKLLNNPAAGTRKMEIQLKENKTDVFYVDIFSTAYRRPVEIK